MGDSPNCCQSSPRIIHWNDDSYPSVCHTVCVGTEALQRIGKGTDELFHTASILRTALNPGNEQAPIAPVECKFVLFQMRCCVSGRNTGWFNYALKLVDTFGALRN
jgi:hypothetical protein